MPPGVEILDGKKLSSATVNDSKTEVTLFGLPNAIVSITSHLMLDI